MSEKKTANSAESTRFDELLVGIANDARSSRRWGWSTLASSALLVATASLPQQRAPLPGEFFTSSGLNAPWWIVLVVGLFGLAGYGALNWLKRTTRDAPPAKQLASAQLSSDHLTITPEKGARRTFALQDVVNIFDDRSGDALVLRMENGESVTVNGPETTLSKIRAVAEEQLKSRAARLPTGGLVARFGAATWFGFVVCFANVLGLIARYTQYALSAIVQQPSDPQTTTHLIVLTLSLTLMALGQILLRRREVVVGSDGVNIQGIRRRFIPYGAIHDVVRRADGGVNLLRHHGPPVHIPGTAGSSKLEERIRAAMDRHAAHESKPKSLLPERAAKNTEAWKSALIALRKDSHYREQALRIEELNETLENHHASPQERVAAALVLAGNEAGRKRIRIEADQLADIDLEAALRAAAEGEIDEAALDRATEQQFVGPHAAD